MTFETRTGVCITEYLTNVYVPYVIFISIVFHCIFSSWGFLELDMVDLIIFFN